MEKEQVIVVGVLLKDADEVAFHYSMEELGRLVDTANGEVISQMVQKNGTRSKGKLYRPRQVRGA